MAVYLKENYQIPIRRACGLSLLHNSVRYYKPVGRLYDHLRVRMREIAATRIRYGFERIYILMRREGYKRLYRIYIEEGLNLRSKRPRRSRYCPHRLDRVQFDQAHNCWSMDFVADQLFDGRKFRALTIVDNYSRKSIQIAVGQHLKGEDVVETLELCKIMEGTVPHRIQVDNGSEFISKALDRWAYDNKVILDFFRPGKPTDNPFIESFNRKFRDECLSVNWFLSLDNAKQKIAAWRREYNHERPHQSLNNLITVEMINLSFKSEDSILDCS